jgi:acetyl-CoA carboxylase beta subunit
MTRLSFVLALLEEKITVLVAVPAHPFHGGVSLATFRCDSVGTRSS